MKYCPECGTKLTAGTAKFCTDCGKNLWETTPIDDTPIIQSKELEDENEVIRKEEEKKEQTEVVAPDTAANTPNYSLGTKLEETVEQILNGEGYSTERRKKIVGKSNTENEIDIYAKKGSKKLAVECKNYAYKRKVGVEEIKYFQSKIEDLQFITITDKLFVTNVQYSADAQIYADYNKIVLWNDDKLRDKIYLMNIGRLSSRQEIVLNFSLPIKVGYKQATKCLVVNPYAVMPNVTLVLHPYFVFDYEVYIRRGFLGRGERIRDQGTYIVDSLGGEYFISQILQNQGSLDTIISFQKIISKIKIQKEHSMI